MNISKRVKQSVAAAVLAGTVVSASAGHVYLGAAYGTQNFNMDKKGRVNLVQASSIYPVNNKDSVVSAGGNLYVGYEQPVSHWFSLSAEIDASIGAAKTFEQYKLSSGDATYSAQENLRYTYGISLLPEFTLSKKIQLFLRAGVGNGNIQSKATGFMGGQASTVSYKKNDFYYNFGAGLDLAVAKHWRLRAGGDYVLFTPYTRADDATVYPPGSSSGIPVHSNITNKIHSLRVLVGLNYQF